MHPEVRPDDGHVRLVAANGDELFGIYGYPQIDDGSPINITGGTGRFEGATGELAISYYVIPQFMCEPADWDDEDAVFACMDFSVSWPWFATLSGTISY